MSTPANISIFRAPCVVHLGCIDAGETALSLFYLPNTHARYNMEEKVEPVKSLRLIYMHIYLQYSTHTANERDTLAPSSPRSLRTRALNLFWCFFIVERVYFLRLPRLFPFLLLYHWTISGVNSDIFFLSPFG